MSGGASNPNQHRLVLEQEAVASGELSLIELNAMVSLARSGISAKAYIANNCPATVTDGNVVVDLRIFAWPSHRQDYMLSAATSIVTIDAPVAIEQERDFDLIIDGDSVDLPCLAASAIITWQSPAILANGKEIEVPEIYGYDVDQGRMVGLGDSHGAINRLRFSQACFGVLRIRCTAIGYSHALTLTIPKGNNSISDVKEIITAAWSLADGTTDATTLEIELPPCVETLLESCDDGSSVGSHLGGIKKAKYRKQLRYSTCTGKMIDYHEVEL